MRFATPFPLPLPLHPSPHLQVIITKKMFKEKDIEHLHLPTVDFFYAPSIERMDEGVEFIKSKSAISLSSRLFFVAM